MLILNSYNSYSLLPLNFSECGYLTNLVEVLKKELSDDYALQIIYPGAKIIKDSNTKYNFAIHISNEVNFDNSYYNHFDFIFRYYLSHKCDYKKVFPINIGYNSSGYENINLDFDSSIKLSSREIDVFFYGNRFVRKSFYKKIKDYINIYDINFSDSYRSGLNILDYRRKLSNSKICLAPGGASPETFRYTEAFASGCIVINDYHSDVWYMKDSPSIYLKDWHYFSKDHIEDILNYVHIGDYHERALNYYDLKLSPRANAYYLLSKLTL